MCVFILYFVYDLRTNKVFFTVLIINCVVIIIISKESDFLKFLFSFSALSLLLAWTVKQHVRMLYAYN